MEYIYSHSVDLVIVPDEEELKLATLLNTKKGNKFLKCIEENRK